jgi:hypothetical protein
MCNKSISATVVILDYSISPTTVFLVVVAVIVFSIKSHSLWARTHISHELLKTFDALPVLTDRDTPTTVVFELLMRGFRATSVHRDPSWVERMVMKTVFRSPLSLVFDNDGIQGQAPARSDLTGDDVINPNLFQRQTVTSKQPSTFSRYALHRNQAVKPNARVVKVGH